MCIYINASEEETAKSPYERGGVSRAISKKSKKTRKSRGFSLSESTSPSSEYATTISIYTDGKINARTTCYASWTTQNSTATNCSNYGR
jgi:hypothetical protein